MLFNITFITEAIAEFEANRTGPMSIASGNCGSWLSLQVIAPNAWKGIADRYESQDAAAYLPSGTDKAVIAGYHAQQKALAQSMRSKDSATYNFFLRGGYEEGSVVYLHPTSRGTVHVNHADPFFSPPEVDYRALSNPADLEVLLEFTPFTRRYFTETRLKALDPVELAPGADITTPAQIEAWLRGIMIPSSFHPIGTAAMMPKNLGGVVDEQLLVYDVKGLSVVDASIMPDLPGSYTQQTVYAVAEKVSRSFWHVRDVLLTTHRLPISSRPGQSERCIGDEDGDSDGFALTGACVPIRSTPPLGSCYVSRQVELSSLLALSKPVG
jgi:hypothetical protein